MRRRGQAAREARSGTPARGADGTPCRSDVRPNGVRPRRARGAGAGQRRWPREEGIARRPPLGGRRGDETWVGPRCVRGRGRAGRPSPGATRDAAAAAALAGERGHLVVGERIGPSDRSAGGGTTAELRRLDEALAAAGGGRLVDAVRRDPNGAARALLARCVWTPDLQAALALQASLPGGWLAVTRDGGAVLDAVTVRIGRGDSPLERRAAADRLVREVEGLQAEAEAAEREQAAAAEAAAEALGALERARAAESGAVARRRGRRCRAGRGPELERRPEAACTRPGGSPGTEANRARRPSPAGATGEPSSVSPAPGQREGEARRGLGTRARAAARRTPRRRLATTSNRGRRNRGGARGGGGGAAEARLAGASPRSRPRARTRAGDDGTGGGDLRPRLAEAAARERSSLLRTPAERASLAVAERTATTPASGCDRDAGARRGRGGDGCPRAWTRSAQVLWARRLARRACAARRGRRRPHDPFHHGRDTRPAPAEAPEHRLPRRGGHSSSSVSARAERRSTAGPAWAAECHRRATDPAAGVLRRRFPHSGGQSVPWTE